jgi:hypothetical protein
MKVELTIPTDLNELTLRQYQKFVKVKEATNDNEANYYKVRFTI